MNRQDHGLTYKPAHHPLRERLGLNDAARDLHAGVWLAFVAGTIFGIDLVLFVQAVGR